MRNLKRALSLTLASIMLLGMMVVGSSAASYQDVTDEHNVEAIEVLQAVGIMVGDEGNFNPEKNVTRNEMAVIMSNLMDYRVASYAGTSPFTDVPAWAEPYVAACYTNGITSGTSATTYNGSGNVTAAQGALMIMKALGYFQYTSDFGTDWQLETARQAGKIDLLNDVKAPLKEAMTRNDVAQLVLNGLQSGMVEADDNTLHIVAGETVVSGGQVNYVYTTSRESYATAIRDDEAAYSGATSTSNLTAPIVDLGEKLYQGDLRRYEGDRDDFGRPSTRWTYKTDEIGVYPDAVVSVTSDEGARYTKKVSLADMYSLLGSANVSKLNLKTSEDSRDPDGWDPDGKNQLIVYVDGAVQSTYLDDNNAPQPYAVRDFVNRNSTAGGNSGKGVLTEVFQDNDNNVTISFTNTYLMQATADYEESNERVRVTVLTGPATENVLNSDDFDGLEGVQEDDYILYTYAKGDVRSVAVAEVLAGDVTSYSKGVKSNGDPKDFGNASGSVSIDGKAYDYAKFAEVDAENGCAVEYNVGVAASIVLDKYGYTIYVDDSSLAVGNYVYIKAIAKETNLGTDVVADAFFTDGTRSTITVKDIFNQADQSMTEGAANKLPGNTTRAEDADIWGWYSYSKNSKDEYTLNKADTTNAFTGVSGALTIDQNRVNIGNEVPGNKNTIFVVYDKNKNVTVYTGIANVPDIVNATAETSWYLREKDKAGKAASAVFIDAQNASVRNSQANLLYLLDKDKTEVNEAGGDPINTWNVVLIEDGTATQTKIETTQAVGNGLWANGVIFENYGVDKDNRYDVENNDKFDATDPDHKAGTLTIAANQAIVHSGDTLILGGGTSFAVDKDTVIALVMRPEAKGNYLSREIIRDINADYKVITNMTAAQLANQFRDLCVDASFWAAYDNLSSNDLLKSLVIEVTNAGTPTADTSVYYDVAANTNVEFSTNGTEWHDTLTHVAKGTTIYVQAKSGYQISSINAALEPTGLTSFKLTRDVVAGDVVVSVIPVEGVDSQFIGKIKFVDATTGAELSGYSVTQAHLRTAAEATAAGGGAAANDLLLAFNIPSGVVITAPTSVDIVAGGYTYPATAATMSGTSGSCSGTVAATAVPAEVKSGSTTSITIKIATAGRIVPVTYEIDSAYTLDYSATTKSLSGSGDISLKFNGIDGNVFKTVTVKYEITGVGSAPVTGESDVNSHTSGVFADTTLTGSSLTPAEDATAVNVKITVEGKNVASNIDIGTAAEGVVTGNTTNNAGIVPTAGLAKGATLNLVTSKVANFTMEAMVKEATVTYTLSGVTAASDNDATGTAKISSGTMTILKADGSDATKATFTVDGDEAVVLTITGVTGVTLDKTAIFNLLSGATVGGQAINSAQTASDVVLKRDGDAWVNDGNVTLNLKGASNFTTASEKAKVEFIDSGDYTGEAAALVSTETAADANPVTVTLTDGSLHFNAFDAGLRILVSKNA